MVDPKMINTVAQKYEEENYNFRTYLKTNADPKELDTQFLKLHKELFDGYDCCMCNNCCRTYAITLNDEDVNRISQHLGKTRDDFVSQYLKKSEFDEAVHVMEKIPCIFLCEDGKCSINEVKPIECKAFPFTDQPNKLDSLLGVIDFAEECPVVFEILERLKVIYRFRRK